MDVDGTAQQDVTMQKTVLLLGDRFRNHIRRIRNMRLIDADTLIGYVESTGLGAGLDTYYYRRGEADE